MKKTFWGLDRLTMAGGALLVALAVRGAPTLTAVNWQAENGVWSGDYTNAAHWEGGVVPDLLNRAYVTLPNSGCTVLTNTFPVGTFETRASQRFNVPGYNGRTYLWDGSGTSFLMPTCDVENYEDEPFRLQYCGSHFFNYQQYSDAASIRYKHAIVKIDNGVFRISSPLSSLYNVLCLDFDAGTFNFYDPEGTPYLTPYFRIGHSAYNNDLTIALHPGVTMKMPGFTLPNNLMSGRTLLFDLNHATLSVYGTSELVTRDAYTDRDTITRFTVTNQALLAFHNLVQLGAQVTATATYDTAGRGYASGKKHYYDVSDGGRITFGGSFYQRYCGESFFTVGAGGTMAFNGENTMLGQSHAQAIVKVEANGRLEGASALTLGTEDESAAHLLVDGGTVDLHQLMLGFSKDPTAVSSLVLTNGASMTTTNFYLGHGSVTVADGINWRNPGNMYLGYKYGEEAEVNVRPGGSLYAGALTIGQTEGAGALNIAGGTVTCSNTLCMGVYATATGTVTVTDGALTCAPKYLSSSRIQVGGSGRGVLNITGGAVTNQALYVPYGNSAYASSAGVVTMSGGEMKISNSLGVGYAGDGLFTLAGGTLRTLYLFLGQSPAKSPDAWGVFHQTGGLCDITVTSNDLGVKMADNVTRKTRLILDGGVMRVMHIFGHVGALCRGGTGYAALSANGGTIQVPMATSRLIYTLDEAKVGPKGLTIDAPYACTIEQDFTDQDDAAGEGRLILAGPAQKTLCATNSTCSYVVAAEGTTLFAPNANGEQAVQDSSLIITNSASVSLAGGQTSLTVKDLTLGNATSDGCLVLDATDKLIVTGALTINRGVLKVTGALTLGTAYDFIELAGDQSEALSDSWSKLRVLSTTEPTAYHSVSVSYDAVSGKTKVSVQKVDTSAALASAIWSGTTDSAWATAANWQNATLPGVMTRAVFDSETAGNSVTLTQAERAAAVVFGAAQGYTLTGGSINLTTHEEGGIAVTQGTNEIASAVTTQSGLPVNVATASAVTLSGAVTTDHLVKTGVGALTLTSTDNTLYAATVSNGTLAVTSPAALGMAAVTQAGGTLALTGAEDMETVYPQAVTWAAAGSTDPLQIVAQHDVTLALPTLTRGLPYKRGAGRLTLTAAANVPLVVNESGTGDWYFKNVTVPLDADGNLPPDVVLGGFNIAEGEVVLRGMKPNVTLDARRFFTVGVPQPSAVTPPALTLDNVALNNDLSSRHLLLGSGFSDSNVQINDVYLTVTNGSAVSANTLYPGRGNTRKNMRYHVLFDNSSLSSSYMMHANAGTGAGSLADYVFRNGSTLFTKTINVPYRAQFLFDASTLAKNAALDPMTLTYKLNVTGRELSGADYTFQNGALFCCNSIDVYGACNQPSTFTFDNAEWRTGAADYTFVYTYPAQVKFYVKNEGLILAPPAGGTWTMANAIGGAGGLIKRGAGTLVFDTPKRINASSGDVEAYTDASTTLDFTGAAKVEAGTLKIASGAAKDTACIDIAAGAVLDLDGGESHLGALSGTGTVQNGRLLGALNLTVDEDWQVSSSALTFSNVTFGRVYVDFGRTSANPITLPTQTIVVGHYTGAAPDVSSWWVKNTGIETACGRFTAQDGNIYLTVGFRGLTINFR